MLNIYKFNLIGEWKWVNNKTITNTNLTLGRYWWDWSGSHGDCGSLALLKNNDLIMRSAPCLSTSARFICEYSNFFNIFLFLINLLSLNLNLTKI